jgi:hypothetical protein
VQASLTENRELISREIQANQQQLVNVQERITRENHDYSNIAKIIDSNHAETVTNS